MRTRSAGVSALSTRDARAKCASVGDRCPIRPRQSAARSRGHRGANATPRVDGPDIFLLFFVPRFAASALEPKWLRLGPQRKDLHLLKSPGKNEHSSSEIDSL